MIRISIRRRDVDQFGDLTPTALHTIRCLLDDAPASSLVRIDLGPVRRLQLLLVRDLRQLECSQLVQFESPDWRVARDHEWAHDDVLSAPA